MYEQREWNQNENNDRRSERNLWNCVKALITIPFRIKIKKKNT